MTSRTATAIGASALLLGSLTATAHAAPAADPVDVETRLFVDRKSATPGTGLTLRSVADVMSGEVPELGLVIALPEGVTFDRDIDDATTGTCTPTPDGRGVTCARDGSSPDLSVAVGVKVGKDVPVGTKLTFTATADLGDVVDSKPENNTATGTVDVLAGGDIGIAWTDLSGPATPGKDVLTNLVITNHGPADVPYIAVRFSVGEHWPKTGDKRCWADPGTITCDLNLDLAAGESFTLPFTWNFPKKAAGTTYRIPAYLLSTDSPDPNKANNEDELTIEIAKAPGPNPTKPNPTATTSPTATANPTSTSTPTSTGSATPTQPGATPRGPGGGALAESGAGPLAGTAAAATVLTLAGALLLRSRNRRTAARRSH